MIGDREHICKNEEEIKHAIKNKNKVIYAYGDIEIGKKTEEKIKKQRIWIIGKEREINDNKRDKENE